jgi:hypothetical protein
MNKGKTPIIKIYYIYIYKEKAHYLEISSLFNVNTLIIDIIESLEIYY